MKRVLTAVVLIPIVLAILFRAPAWLFTAVVGVISLLATREYLDLAEAHGTRPFRITTYIIVIATFVGAMVREIAVARLLASRMQGLSPKELATAGYFADAARTAGFFTLYPIVFFAALIFLVLALRQPELRSSLPAAAYSFLAMAYTVGPLVLLTYVRDLQAGIYRVFYLLVVVWTGDIVAYYIGRAVGRHKLAPRVSPNKTWEGAIGSFVGATAVGTGLLALEPTLTALFEWWRVMPVNPVFGGPAPAQPLWVCILVSAAINVAAQLGDLAESALKRGAGVKDSGAILPGHGGMLDRIDALLFAAPALWYYATIAYAFGTR